MPSFNLHYFLTQLGQSQKDIFVLQIGAMDGKTFDPIYPFVQQYQWPGLMVEPIPRHFEALKRSYSDNSHIQFENAAITEKTGPVTMYTLPQEHLDHKDVPKWGAGASSLYLDRNALEFDNIQPFIQEINVQGLTLKDLLNKHHIDHIDILQIDAEGHDYHILKQLDFAKFNPKVINLEFVNLPKTEQGLVKKLLDQNNYIYIKAGYDLLAVKGFNI